MTIRKVIVISFSLLMLPSLSQAQCANETSAQCSDAKAAEVKQSDKNTITNTGESSVQNEATTTTTGSVSTRNNKRRAERQFPRFEAADPRDTVLSSEICVYSSATYTYTCR